MICLVEPSGDALHGPEDGLQRSVPHLLRDSIEMMETLSCDLDLIHAATSDVVPQMQPLAMLSVAV